MLKRFTPHPYQSRMIQMIQTDKSVALWAEMGLGKTVTCLTAAEDNIYDRVLPEKWLVLAPKFVADHTWTSEWKKWDHLKDLRVVKVVGTPKQREEILKQDADVYVMCRNLIPWIFKQYADVKANGRWKWKAKWPFDKVVLDESSCYKKASGVWFKTLAKIGRSGCQFIELTGTPSPKFLEDLWSQTFLLDRGERLGNGVGKFRDKYMRVGGHIKTGARDIPIWEAKPMAYEQVMEEMSDIAVTLKSEDWLKMPEIVYNDVEIPMPPAVRQVYDDYKRDWVWVKNDQVVTSGSAANTIGKLLQMCNGNVYDENQGVVPVHDVKLKALVDLVSGASGPVLVFYAYKHDRDDLLRAVSGAEELTAGNIDRWNQGEIPVMITHPASAGHGLNLQGGGNTVIWYGLPFNLEFYLQANARLYRQGQKADHVIINHLVMADSIEQMVADALQRKDLNQQAIMNEVRYVSGDVAKGTHTG